MDFETIPAKQLNNYIGQYNTIIIDLRDKEDYHEGHIPTAVNIPYNQLSKYKYKIGKFYQVIVYCERGSKSLLAARELCKLGYYVINVYGGFNAYRGKIEVEDNPLAFLD